MTILPDETTDLVGELEVFALEAQLTYCVAHLIAHLSVGEVLGRVAAGYRSLEEGSVTAGRCREVADELESVGIILSERYGV